MYERLRQIALKYLRHIAIQATDAARAEGIRVGFYYSLMDWHHPDGALCATDEKARRRFVDYTHGLIRELMTNYGKIDVLWYDVDWPLSSEQWESRKLNDMVFALQPDILINNRSGIAGDFSTPEQKTGAPEAGGPWESCMTLNDSWGYCLADHNWKSPETILHNLLACAKGGGNFLLNTSTYSLLVGCDAIVTTTLVAFPLEKTTEIVKPWRRSCGPRIVPPYND